jgi:hypothetical protein
LPNGYGFRFRTSAAFKQLLFVLKQSGTGSTGTISSPFLCAIEFKKKSFDDVGTPGSGHPMVMVDSPMSHASDIDVDHVMRSIASEVGHLSSIALPSQPPTQLMLPPPALTSSSIIGGTPRVGPIPTSTSTVIGSPNGGVMRAGSPPAVMGLGASAMSNELKSAMTTTSSRTAHVGSSSGHHQKSSHEHLLVPHHSNGSPSGSQSGRVSGSSIRIAAWSDNMSPPPPLIPHLGPSSSTATYHTDTPSPTGTNPHLIGINVNNTTTATAASNMNNLASPNKGNSLRSPISSRVVRAPSIGNGGNTFVTSTTILSSLQQPSS